ncbi:hypothetical protein HanIR_Chr10g0456911 [Helianthus annuus]|nr:hypothetical protein HanIR_Chr10g0456911 [Helianthus annuus]
MEVATQNRITRNRVGGCEWDKSKRWLRLVMEVATRNGGCDSEENSLETVVTRNLLDDEPMMMDGLETL